MFHGSSKEVIIGDRQNAEMFEKTVKEPSVEAVEMFEKAGKKGEKLSQPSMMNQLRRKRPI